MSESWREKRYYRPRVLIPVSDLETTETPDGLFFLTGAQVGVIRTLLAYCHRRVTWVSEYRESDYLTPTPEEWDLVESFTAELEDALMSTCCEDVVNALNAINTTLAAQGVTLADISTTLTAQGVTLADIDAQLAAIAGDTPDIVTALECLCAKQEQTLINVTVSPDWVNYPGATDAFDWGTTNPVTTVGAQAAADACALAQAWYQSGYEWMTEFVLPALRFGFDKLIPAAAAAIAVWTGGVGLPAAIGVYAAAELIQELLELGYDAAETNLENWLYTHKDDIVCPLYLGMLAGGTSVALWDPVKTDLVDVAPDLSAGDKFMVNLVMRYWGLGAATVAKEQNSEWYQSIQTPGYCDTCEEPPTVGSNWVAMPVGDEDGLIQVDHPAGGYWIAGCWGQQVAAGFTMVGMLVEVTARSAGCEFKWMDGPGQGCGSSVGFSPNTSDQMPSTGWYYMYAPYTHNNTEVVSTLAPGATTYDEGLARAGYTTLSQAFTMGWNCTGSATLQVRYIVYAGTTPPPYGY